MKIHVPNKVQIRRYNENEVVEILVYLSDSCQVETFGVTCGTTNIVPSTRIRRVL